MSEHNYDEEWQRFLDGAQKSRESEKSRALPTQFMAVRDGQELGYGTAEVNAQGIAQMAIAILTAFGSDEVFICMDSYFAGEQKVSPHTGEKWVEGEMEFDYRENPDTKIKEALMYWGISHDHAAVVRHQVRTYARTPEGIVFDEPMDHDADTSDSIHHLLDSFWHHSQNPYGKLMDSIREQATSEWRLATLDVAGMKQMNEMMEFGTFALIAHDDGSERTRVLTETQDPGVKVSEWMKVDHGDS